MHPAVSRHFLGNCSRRPLHHPVLLSAAAVALVSCPLTATSLSNMSLAGKRRHSSNLTMYPRAAVATTVQLVVNPSSDAAQPKYLLVQRANPPDQGKWSIPGGKIELGETTLQAAQREILEETQIPPSTCQWHADPFMTTDAIVEQAKEASGEQSPTQYAFHYVIAQCFARISVENGDEAEVALTPSDDALDAKWFSLTEIEALQESKEASNGVVKVIERAEQLSKLGAFDFFAFK